MELTTRASSLTSWPRNVARDWLELRDSRAAQRLLFGARRLGAVIDLRGQRRRLRGPSAPAVEDEEGGGGEVDDEDEPHDEEAEAVSRITVLVLHRAAKRVLLGAVEDFHAHER